MALKDQLMDDLKQSMKDKDNLKKSVITLIRSAIKQYEVDNRVEADDDKVIDTISKQLKQRRDSLVEFEKAQREDLVDQTKKEIDVLVSYLPEQMSAEEVKSIVVQTISETGASSVKDMGRLMAALMPKLKGKADGKLINEIAKELLQ
ncbi:YqeY-like protein [Peptoclostridium acidaminophilum DSM 3953]|uniref:YqeY-like protein n=1 Tax=Peptoclostridium acidaminophilum DSM 3953 TaxID=1286171 RepID=W8T787_PEPAC|nr:GatB/YqeY domain-containing protein [Peptoclostridium acidaminophilum]AHM56730.1 YqeY-like protein [Peptoclostridium acidaminophilum DSM 3953]